MTMTTTMAINANAPPTPARIKIFGGPEDLCCLGSCWKPTSGLKAMGSSAATAWSIGPAESELP